MHEIDAETALDYLRESGRVPNDTDGGICKINITALAIDYRPGESIFSTCVDPGDWAAAGLRSRGRGGW